MSGSSLASAKKRENFAWRQKGFRDGRIDRPKAVRGVDVPEEYWSDYCDGHRCGKRENVRSG